MGIHQRPILQGIMALIVLKAFMVRGKICLIITYAGKQVWKVIVFPTHREYLFAKQLLNYKNFHFEFEWKLNLDNARETFVKSWRQKESFCKALFISRAHI